MAITFFSGFETGDFGEWSSTTGSPTVVEADGWGAPKTGDYCMRCNTDATTAYVVPRGTALKRYTAYVYIASTPTGDCDIFLGHRFRVVITSTRYVKLENTGGVEIGTSTTQLDEGVWYRISASGSYVNPYPTKLYINGIEEVSGDGSITTTTHRVGISLSSTADIYFDNFAADTEDSTDDLGDIRVLRSSPNAAGAHAEFDTISGYTYCDEVPADGATTIVDDSGVSAMHRETYNLQDHDTIGIGASDTWVGVNVWVQGYDSGASLQGITVRDDGTDYETLAEFGKAYTWKNKLYLEAPRASAWTKEIFDAFQAGGYSEGSKDVYMSSVMVMVAFIPEEVGAPVVVTPPAANLILTTYVPIVTVTENIIVTPTTANLILTTYAPTVSVSGVGVPAHFMYYQRLRRN